MSWTWDILWLFLVLGIGMSPVALMCIAGLIFKMEQDWCAQKRTVSRAHECSECEYFDEFQDGFDVMFLSGRGFCRRNAPVGCIDDEDITRGVFPTVYFSDSCGEFMHSDLPNVKTKK